MGVTGEAIPTESAFRPCSQNTLERLSIAHLSVLARLDHACRSLGSVSLSLQSLTESLPFERPTQR